MTPLFYFFCISLQGIKLSLFSWDLKTSSGVPLDGWPPISLALVNLLFFTEVGVLVYNVGWSCGILLLCLCWIKWCFKKKTERVFDSLDTTGVFVPLWIKFISSPSDDYRVIVGIGFFVSESVGYFLFERIVLGKRKTMNRIFLQISLRMPFLDAGD